MILTVAYALWGVNEQTWVGREKSRIKARTQRGYSPRTLAFAVCRDSRSNDY